MTMKEPYSRRDIPKMLPDILGRYRDLVTANDLPGYEKLLDQYQPHITEIEREILIGDFTRLAEIALRRCWHVPKSR